MSKKEREIQYAYKKEYKEFYADREDHNETKKGQLTQSEIK